MHSDGQRCVCRALSSLAKKHRLALANEKDRAITAENSLMAAKLRIERVRATHHNHIASRYITALTTAVCSLSKS